jgi:hypothetical protein
MNPRERAFELRQEIARWRQELIAAWTAEPLDVERAAEATKELRRVMRQLRLMREER